MSQINDGPVEPGVRRVNKERVGSLNIPPKFMEKQSVKGASLNNILYWRAGRGRWFSGRGTFKTGLEERGIYMDPEKRG